MKLATGVTKSNGLTDGGSLWYVATLCPECKDAPFTISKNPNRAHQFTQAEADEFNRTHLASGKITREFSIIKY